MGRWLKNPAKGDYRSLRQYKNDDGTITWHVRIYNSDKQLVFHSTDAKTHQAAKALRDEVKGQLRALGVKGKAAAFNPLSVALEWYRDNVCSVAKGGATEATTVGLLLDSAIAKKRLIDVTVGDVDEWMQARVDGKGFKRPVLPATADRNRHTLAGAITSYSDAKGFTLPDGNPALKAKKIRVEFDPSNRVRRGPTPDELTAIIDYLESHEYHNDSTGELIDHVGLFNVGLTTGMRLGTLCSLTYKQVNLDKRIVYTTAEQQKAGEAMEIPLIEAAADELLRMFEASGKKTEARIWPVASANAASMHFSRIFREKLKLPSGVVFHSTRHDFADFIFNLFGDALTARKYTGHKTNKAFEGYTSDSAEGRGRAADEAIARRQKEQERKAREEAKKAKAKAKPKATPRRTSKAKAATE